MEECKGCISNVVYHNDENGYTVFEMQCEDGSFMTCVGVVPFINEGEFVVAKGNYVTHHLYGEQFSFKSIELVQPEDKLSMLRYLSSGAITGIREGLAKRIVERFGDKTFEIMEKEPERLQEVKGISEKKARQIGIQFEEKKDMRAALVFLQKYGISNNLAVRVYRKYKQELYTVIENNPYQLADDIKGVGFKIADDIARRVGFDLDSKERIRAGITYVLNNACNDGNVFLTKEELIGGAVEQLGVSIEATKAVVDDMKVDRSIVVSEENYFYLPSLYYSELNCARMLTDLNVSFRSASNYEKLIDEIIKREKLEIDKSQRQAVIEAMDSGLLVITGGPGTGKTTTINMIIECLKSEGMDILLAAPTGRAAKRMTETTGNEAQTIHRLLEYNASKMSEDEDRNIVSEGELFGRNEWNPLETDVLIIDEMSMVDIFLFHSLLKAISIGTRLILVGDVNQLPSVGPGNVLKDIIESRCFNVVELTTIFRQAAQSDIVVNAHRINAGNSISLDNKSKDFFCLKRDDAHGVLEVMLWLVRDKMPKYVNCTPFDIQVLTPMKMGELGVKRCNEVLQMYLNPESPQKNQIEVHDTILREGDKVMQIKNNYQLEWEIRGYNKLIVSEGTGVFNGDCGIIEEVDTYNKAITVKFDDDKYVHYTDQEFEELELAYAITVHKSQGSEYPVVILPLLSVPRPLMNRNILYTAVTRGKNCVTIVGSKACVENMIAGVSDQVRNSTLAERIIHIDD